MHTQNFPSQLPRLLRRAWISLVTLLLFGGATGWSHNLDMQINYLIFDKETTALVQSRAAANQPLMQAGDTVGVILKATPNAGTKTGAGGYSTFFVPVGSQIVGAEYGVVQDNGTFQPLAMKGQSPLVHGQGPIDVQAPIDLAGFTLGPNVLGISALSVDLKCIPWGTLAGLYGDTGIFYSTDPATAWQSWVNSGGIDKNPGTSDNAIQNNKGDTIIPTTLWDAHQMFGFGVKTPGKPIIDPDGRGNTPWGTGTPVAGPESGYAWGFNKAYWDANPSNPNRMRNSLQVGPWRRIRYAGSEIAKDTPGRRGTSALDLVGVNGENYGVAVSPSSPLPPTTSWTDSTSPKALRLSWGGLELYRPEYCRIKVKILKNPGESGAPFDPNGYLQLFGETFGGDAGGEYGNKDHVWRYYKPSVIGLSASPMIEMVASKKIVLPNELFSFDVRITNLGNLPMTNAILENPLPASLTFVSATPAQNAGPSALRWNLGTLPPQSTRTLRINVRANTTGLITNKATIRSNEFPTPKEAADTVTSDFIAIMYGDKSVTPTTAAPGGKVIYKIVVRNDGACPNRSPWKVREFLPDGFRYTRTVDQFINGARTANTVVVPSATVPGRPEFVINRALDVGKTLEIFFEAELSTTQAPGQYFNRYAVDYDDKVYATGLIAPVTVGGARVGDLVYQDWNGNATRDANEPGLANVELQLWTDPNSDGNPADGVLVRTTTTNAQGEYNFGGTSTGNYVVRVNSGVPSGYQLTADPEGPLNGLARLSLTNSTDRLDIDFGYRPLGTLTIAGLVFSDFANDGIYQAANDTVINSIPLTLHFDANGNGTVDAPDIQIATATSASGGAYTFSNIAPGLSYVVSVSTTAPALTTFFNPFTFKPSSPARIAIGSLTANTSGRNFGFFADRPASIGDQVFQDLNRNGVFDSGDLAIPRVTVKLYRDINNNKAPGAGEYLREVVTDNRGQYLFTDLSGDNYIAEVDLTDPDLPGGLALAPPHIAVTVLPSEENLNIDFALKRVLSLSVSPTGTVAPGSRLTYSLQANYPQVGQFTNVAVTDTIPTGTTYTSGSASTGATFASNTVTWNLGSTSSSVANTFVPVITCVRNVRIEVDASVDDTYIRADSASTVLSSGNMILRPSSAATQRQALIRFLTTEIPAGATVLSATVGLRVANTRSNQTVNLFPLNTAWDVGVATWNDPNGTGAGRWASGTTFSALDYNSSLSLGSFTPNTVGYKLVTSTNLRNTVQGWVNNPSSNRGIGIITMGTDTGDAQIFSIDSTINNVPYLDVQYSYVAADACGVDSRGAAHWARNGLLNGRTATWNGGSFDATQTTPALAADLEFIVGASSSKRDEKIIAGILEQTENNIVGQMWNGSAWTNLPLNPLGRAATTSEVGVAVAYEQLSGDAILVWTDRYQASGQRLRFSVWNGTSWTTPVSITSYTGAEPSGLKMVAKPDSDEMALVIEDWNYSKHAIIWNGSSWNSSIQLAPGTSDNNNIFDFAVAYENLTGRAMALYGKNGQNHVYYRLWNGSSWTAEASRTAPSGMGRKRHFTAASDPGGNRIAVGVITDGSDAWCCIWNGSSWSAGNVVETDLNTRDAPTLAVAFESQSGDLVAAYSQNNFAGVKYVTWSPTTSTWSAEADAIPLGADANSLILQPDLNTNEIMLVAQDDNLDLVVTRWSDNIWKGYRELEDNTGENSKQPFIYLWDAHDRNPNPPLTTAEGLFGPASVINNAQIVNVSTTLTSSRNIESIVAPDPSFITLSGTGLTATKLTGPTPGPSTIGNRGTTFTWTYRINGGTSPANGLFRWAQFTSGVATFPTTDSNSFIYVPTLTYQVDVTAPPPNPIITNQATINLGFGAILSNTVSTSLSESIGDFVWADYNMDGNQDADEPGLPGVRVFIDANNNSLFDATERNATSNSQGLYTLSGVGAGTHQVVIDVVTLPLDFAATTATRLTRTLAAGQSSFTCDFGVAPRPPEVATGTIGGLVWIDSNADGIVDVLETGFPGAIAKLWSDSNANGILDSNENLVASTTSGADGRYLFENLYAGRYLVTNEPATPGVALVSGHIPLTGVVSVNLTPTSIPPAPPVSNTSTLLNVSKGTSNIPITGVQIRRAGTTPIVQSSSASSVTLVTADTLELTQLNILDSGIPKSLNVVNRGGGIVRNVSISPSSTNYGVVISGGFQSIASLGADNFTKVASSTASNSDLNNYIADDRGEGTPDGSSEYDMLFDLPYNSDDYVVISERFGNSTARLTPLDATGNVIPNCNTIQIGSPYDWNTGLASPYISSQPYWITVVKAATFGTTQPIHGFRVDTAGADLKFFGMSDSLFIDNLGTSTTFLTADFGYRHTASIGDFIYYDFNGNGIRNPNGVDGIAGNADDEVGINDATVQLIIDSNADGIAGPFEPVYGITSTNASGFYLFPFLPPGRYVAKAEEQSVIAPPSSSNAGLVGFMLPTTPEGVAVNLAPAQAFLNADYGFIEKSIIEGYVYHDVDSSTLKDPAEPGLPNVDVRIIGTDIRGNAVDLTVATNAGGQYTHFVAPGSYTLTYNAADPDLPAGLTRATTPLAYTLDVLPGKELEGMDFGRDHNGTLGGRVFNDDNSNGAQNRGEDGIPDITVQLFDSAGTNLLFTTTTNHIGDYRFTGLPDGTFTVVVLHSSLPLGYNTTPTADPDAVKDGRSRPVVTSTTPNLTQIFGYRHSSTTHTLSGLIFDDSGAGGGTFSNGVRDGTEPGLAGASVRIEIDLDKDGTIDEYRVATSESTGAFISNGVPTAANILLFVLDRSLPRRAYTPTLDPNGPTDGRANLAAITGNVSDLVFGFALKPSTISGSVVLGDGNGIADPGETPLSNVIVRLTYGGNDDVIGTADDIVTTRSTDASGLYSADNLDPGVFQIVQSVPFGYKPRADADGGVPTNISLSVAPGALPTKQDFEDYQLPQIRGRVLVDADRSGDISVDDTPVQGVTVRLFTDVNGNGLRDAEDTQLNTFVTDALGVYRFGPISDPAKFLVQHDLPNTMISITDADGAANGINHIAVTVEELDINNRDFLNRPIPMTLGGRVFNDLNSNALLGGTESGISALQVRLFDSATSQQIGTVNTLADGSYSFPGLWPGNYFVQITPPSNLPSTGGTPVALDNDVDNDSNALQSGGPGTTVSSPVINMAVNTESITDGDTNPNTNLTVDLGLWSGLNLGNLIWNDSSNDGLKGTTESGISGISVRLFSPGSDNAFGGSGSAADTLVTTVTTDSSGLYNFRTYTPGRYYVRITPPSTHPLASTTSVNLDNGVNDDSNGIQLGSAGNDIISPVILLTAGGEPGSAGTTNTDDTIDIGLRPCPTVSISPTTVLPGAVYGSYTQAFVATGGVAPRTFRISSGSLPTGLTLSSGGVINGTINANQGSYWFRIEARDNQGCIGTRDYTLSVTCPNPVVTPAGPALPDAWHWENYSQTFTATGVAAAYSWSISSGSLPSGLTLNPSSGLLSGTITGAPATYSFTVRATDPLGFCVTDRPMTLLVRGRWDYGDLADSLTGTSANTTAATADHLTRFSENGPRHSIRPGFRLGTNIDEDSDGQPGFLADGDGSDEDGLTLPTTIVAGSSVTATISVTNTIGVTARGNLWIDWNSNGSFEDVGERLVNNSTITGSRAYTITVPIGAVLNRPLGVRVRLTSFSLTNSLGVATDGEVEDYLITAVCPAVAISTPALPTWYLGAAASQTFSATTGTAPYNWTLASGSLPPGLTLTTAGSLSGTPSAIGTYNFTLRATDAYGCSVTRAYTSVIKGITVGNLVFNDTDDNGIRSLWELGVSGVTLEAFNPGADLAIGGTGLNADTLITSVVSNSQGAYGFDNLPVGPVYIRLTPPSTLRVTGGTPVTADNGVNNDNNGAQPGGPGTPLFSPIITLAPGLESIADGDNDPDTELSIDFGIWSGVGIGSTLWGDSNSNGRIDATENGFGTVKVQLWRDIDGDVGNGAEVYVAETTSNVAGHYTFLGYPSGRYQVIIPNSNFIVGGPLNAAPFASPVRAYSDDQIDDDSNAVQFLGGGTEARSPLVTLAAGDEPVGSGLGGVNGEFGRGGNLDDSFPDENADMTLDMGFVAPGSIGVGNLVFVDNNDNGRADSGEGVNGIRVQLFYAGDNPLTDPPLLTTTTANGGRYLFSIVWQGTFFVYLPKDQFTPSGLLNATFPIPGTVPGDDNVGEDSLATSEPWNTGVRSQDFVMAFGSAPTATTGETGTDASSDDAFDSSSDLTIDIGLFRSVGLGNMVFFDANENGRADAGEGVSGVLVELYRENQTPGFNTPLKTTTTQSGGTYLFDLIPAGNYRVHIPASQFDSGMPLFRAVSIAEGLAGDDDVGEDGINAVNPALTGITSRLVTLIPGNTPTVSDGETGVNASSDDDFDSAVDLTIDFGFQNPVGLGNLVFVDFNNDGTYNSGEGIAGVRVELYRASQTPGVDVPVFTQTTAADGHYFFGSLSAGDYRVHIPATQFRTGASLANLAPLALNASGDDDSGQDGITAGIPAVNGVSTAVISLSSGSSPMNFNSESGYRNTDDDLYDNNFDLTIDFGFGPPNNTTVGVGSLVYRDLNGNSRFDSGEGTSGVSIQLFLAGEDPQSAAPLATTSTDLNGLYIFTSLTPGDYFLHIPASQFIPGGALASLFSLPGNGTDNGIDDDIDENGIDSTTPATTGISSSPFNLALGTEPTNDSSEFGEGTYLDALADSNHDLTFDFGFYESVGLGNLVFIDLNGNNHADAGEGVPAVQVELYPNGSLPGWNLPLATTTTDTLGRYAFNDLRPGFYYVHIPYTQFLETAPLFGLLSLTGTTAGDDDLGENGLDQPQPDLYGITSTLVSLTPTHAPVGIEEGGLFGSDDDAKDNLFDATVDFGFAARMSVGNLVFSDINGDGIFNPATESGVEGVDVELWYDTTSTTPAATTQTQSDGSYSFSVAPGTYSVRIPASEFQPGAPLAYTESSKNITTTVPTTAGDDDVGEDGLDLGDPAINGVATPWFTLTPGSAPTDATTETGYLAISDNAQDDMSDLTVDLGFTPKPLAVGNLVFNDVNLDGRYTAGTDQPISGVPLRLFRVGDNPLSATPVAMTVSALDGSYLLKTATAGFYFVHIPPSAFASTGVLFGATSIPGFGNDDGSDDDADENGINSANPASSGTNSNAFELAFGSEPVTAANAPGIETGAFANSDATNEAITDLTIDFGFVGASNTNRVAVGNIVYRDLNTNGRFDEGEGVDGVWMLLYDANNPAGPAAQLASTFTSGGGRYLFSNLPSGQYVVHVAADNFKPLISLNGGTPAPGPLFGQVSRTGTGAGDDNLSEDGIDNANPAQSGINSAPVTLTPGSAPVQTGTETGASLAMNATLGDSNTDLTIDFAFVAAPPPPNSLRQTNTLTLASGSDDSDDSLVDTTLAAAPETYLEWQSRHDLGSLSAPDQDADNDGLSNLLEYGLELDPLSGFEQRASIAFDTTSSLSITYTRPANGHQDARYQLQVLADLSASPSTWTALESPAATIQNPDGTETLTFAPPVGWTQGFVRLSVALDADGNGTPEAQSTTPVHAWLTSTLATGQQSLSQPLLQPALYSGSVQRSGNGSVTLPVTANIASSFTAGRHYYLELNNGHRFEINELISHDNTLVLDLTAPTNTASALPADLSTTRAAIREHWTLDTLLPSTILTAGAYADLADRALFFNSASNQFEARWLQSGTPATWTTDTTAPDHLAPGSALLVHRRGSPVSLLWTGLVRDHTFRLTVRPGTQFIASGFPFTASPASLNLTTTAGLLPGTSATTSDRFRLWIGDTQPGTTGYHSFFFMQTAQGTRWVNQSDATFQDLTTTPLFAPTRGLFLQRLPNTSPLILTFPNP